MSFIAQRTLVLPYPSQQVEKVVSALSLQGNNLYNTEVYVLRNVVSSYDYDTVCKVYFLKEKLHPNQVAALNAFNTALTQVNAKRIATGSSAKQILPLVWAATNIYACILDPTVLDAVLKEWLTAAGDTIYQRLPGVMAQQVRRKVIDAFSGYFGSMSAYYASPSNFTGKPKLPGYLRKGALFVLEFPLAQLNKAGRLPSLSGKHIPVDYAETASLSDEQLTWLDQLELHPLIAAAAKQRGWEKCVPVHLRIVPRRRGHKLEVVMNVPITYPENSFLKNVEAHYPNEMVEHATPKKREAWLKAQLANLPMTRLPNLAGCDFGLNNVVALAYGTGHKADVIGGALLEKTLDRAYQRIADFQEASTTLRMRELQRQKTEAKDKKTIFPVTLHRELNGLLSAMYATPRYTKLQAELQNTVQNALHQLSNGIVGMLQKKRVDVFVVGLNKGWKDASTLGKDNRTRFGRIAHSRLLALLRYKCEEVGIAVLTTEESYTSQASFADNEKMAPRKPEKKQDKQNNTVTKPSTLLKQNYRDATNRNRFHNVTRSDRWSCVHADVNGAFNMLRKIFKQFVYHDKLTFKFSCWRLSPSFGLL